MSAEQLAAIAGIVLSLLFSYVPGLKDWFDALLMQQKQLVMGAALFLVAAAIFGLTCANLVSLPGLTCDVPGLLGFVKVLIAALIANQSVWLITRKKSLPQVQGQ